MSFNLPPRQPEMLPDFVRALPQDGRDILAVYDADGTMWRDDVADDFTKWMIDTGHADGSLWDEYLRIYRDDHAAGCRYLLMLYRGLPYDEFRRLIWEWWREHAQRNWIVEVVESIYYLADVGYTIWIVTGSPSGTMLPVPDFLPIHRTVGMDFEIDDDGIITGNVAGISCADEGKAEKVRALWGDKPILLSAGNGSLDRWMMELSTNVIWSVFPNSSFHEYSKAQGWHILPRPADFVEEAKLA